MSDDRLANLIDRLAPVVVPGSNLIRLGPDGDGGYLVPDDLCGVTACFSAGVGQVAGFEHDCAERGMDVYLADGSVLKPPNEHPRFHFTPHHLGPESDLKHLAPSEWFLNSLESRKGDLLLQMDIDGDEYAVLSAVPPAWLSRFRIIVVEFHRLHRLVSRDFLSDAEVTFDVLLRDHRCVHIHPNNCCGSVVACGLEIPRVAEFTFLRRDRFRGESKPANVFPHPLDRDNTSRPTLVLPTCWRKPTENSYDS